MLVEFYNTGEIKHLPFRLLCLQIKIYDTFFIPRYVNLHHLLDVNFIFDFAFHNRSYSIYD